MPPAAKHSSVAQEDRSGLLAGVAAFGTWGLIPVYWKLFTNISASQILAHRFVWTTCFLVGMLSWQQRWPEVREGTRSRRAVLYCLASGLAISVNWFCFIWAVNVGRVLETSLEDPMNDLRAVKSADASLSLAFLQSVASSWTTR